MRVRISSLAVPIQHQIKIAKSTLRMSDAGARIMGGMTKEEARALLKQHGIPFKREIAKPVSLAAPYGGPDFSVRNEGSIFLLTPNTPSAREWITAHIPDDAQILGIAVVVEHRYIADIVAGIQSDGLAVRQ